MVKKQVNKVSKHTDTKEVKKSATGQALSPETSPPASKTVAQKIWDDIKDKPLDMFGVPGLTAAKYCQPVPVDPNKLYLGFTVSAVLPALELAYKGKYEVELVDRFIVLSHKKVDQEDRSKLPLSEQFYLSSKK